MFSIIVVKTGEVVELFDKLDVAFDFAKERAEQLSLEGKRTNCDCCGPEYPPSEETEVAVEGDGMKYRFIFSASYGSASNGEIQEKYEDRWA